MNCFERVVKDFKREQRKRKHESIRNIATFTVIGIVIGGAITMLLAEELCEKIKNMVIENDIKVKRSEVKKMVENVDNESVGDLGVEMKKALEDLED